MRIFSIAIDGPSGAGKSSVAKEIAKVLGAMYLDTGAMYRAVGLHMLRQGIDLDDQEKIAQSVREVPLRVAFQNGEQRMYLGETDVSEEIRTPQASVAASKVSAVPQVRETLVALQRKIAQGNCVVMDGRDIGTHVLPGATLKVFLTASDEVRAQRRYLELVQRGKPQPYEEVLSDMRQRDSRDSSRAASPLKKAEDAVEVDCSNMSLSDVIEEILRLARERIGGCFNA